MTLVFLFAMPISRKMNPRARATRRRSVPKFWKNKTVRNTIIAALSLAGITVVGVTGRQILLRSKHDTGDETPPLTPSTGVKSINMDMLARAFSSRSVQNVLHPGKKSTVKHHKSKKDVRDARDIGQASIQKAALKIQKLVRGKARSKTGDANSKKEPVSAAAPVSSASAQRPPVGRSTQSSAKQRSPVGRSNPAPTQRPSLYQQINF